MFVRKYFSPPALSFRFWSYWRRNFLVWQKIAIASVLGNLADPMLYMLGLGYGLGTLLPNVEGTPYINFLAGGSVCYSAMNTATFEVLYSGYSRMSVQKTWEAVLNAPLTLDDIVFGELIWAASKSLLAGVAILLIIWVLNFSNSPIILWIVPLSFVVGLCFAGMGLVVTALSFSYDFFLYYFTLVVTPMTLICGVFYPVSQLPPILQSISGVLPLTHAVELLRPIVIGKQPVDVLQHIAVLMTYGLIGFYAALILMRRRFLK